MNSIRKRLLFYILSILMLGTVAVCLSTYLGIRHEMDELYNSNMRQMARMSSGMIGPKDQISNALAFSEEWPRGEEVFLIQIWKKQKLVYSSHPIANFPLQEKPGFGHTYLNEKKWVYYQEPVRGHIVQVSQELKVRREVIREVYNAILIPILIQFPILAALVWFFFGYGFRPLLRLSALIQTRTANFMEPIAPEDTPQEIRTIVSALNGLLHRLKLSMETQRQFTADAAHELRTPLTAVRLQLDLLQRANAPQDRQEALDTLERGVGRSIRLVQQLLELARQEPDNDLQEFSDFNLPALVHDIAEEHAPLAHQKSITLDSDLINVTVKGDAASLSVLIGNLVSNALAYTPAGGHILLKTYMAEGHPVLEVSDNGIGIAPEDRIRIFDRFYRVVGTGTSGSGLGLSIVKNIADRHNARIEVSSGLNGSGTTFKVTF